MRSFRSGPVFDLKAEIWGPPALRSPRRTGCFAFGFGARGAPRKNSQIWHKFESIQAHEVYIKTPARWNRSDQCRLQR